MDAWSSTGSPSCFWKLPSTWSPCPASMHWHHRNGLAGVGYTHWKRARQASASSFIFPTKWTELHCEENVDTFDPEDTGSLE